MTLPLLLVVLLTAAGAAFFFASASVLVRAGQENKNSLTALWISLLTNVIVLWGLSFILYGFNFHPWQWRYFALAGLFAPLLGRMFRYLAMDKIGVNISSPIVQIHPFLAIALAIFFLKEHLSAAEFLAGFFAVLGSVLVSAGGIRGGEHIRKKYLLIPLVATLCYATSTILRRIGIQLGTPSITAGAVTVTVSWFVLTVSSLIKPELKIMQASRKGVVLFVLSGIVSSIAVPLYYYSLLRGNVVIVMPVMASQAVFTLLLSYFFLRHNYKEIFNPLVVAGTFCVTGGVALLGVFGSVH